MATCRAESVRLLERNLTPDGIVAATPSARSQARGYGAIFGRDAAVCALGMAVSGDAGLELAAANGLATLAAYQAPNGQIPKFVDTHRAEADFWYLGCIDATLWWLVGVALLDRLAAAWRLRERWHRQVERAIHWLACQEHQRFFLLQQNEASDWADIMPRSGFVLYSNALWHLVKRLYALPKADETRRSANSSSTPSPRRSPSIAARGCLPTTCAAVHEIATCISASSTSPSTGMRATSSATCSRSSADSPTSAAAHRVLRALERAQVNDPYPARTVCDPITPEARCGGPICRATARISPGSTTTAASGRSWADSGWRRSPGRVAPTQARRDLVRLAQANALRRLAVQRVAARPHPRAGRHARPVVERGGVPHRLRRAGAKPALPDRAQSTISRFSTDLTPSTDRAT